MDRFDKLLFKELAKNRPYDRKIVRRVVKRVLFLHRIKRVFNFSLLAFIFYPVIYILFFGIPIEFIDFILNFLNSISILIVTGGFFYLLYISLLIILFALLLIFVLKTVKQIRIKPRIN